LNWYGGRIVVTLLAVLLDGLGSAVLPVREAVLVMLPMEVAVAVMVRVARLPLVSVPRLKTIDPPLLLQLPSDALADRKVVPNGNAFVRTTSEAVSGPRLVTLSI